MRALLLVGLGLLWFLGAGVPVAVDGTRPLPPASAAELADPAGQYCCKICVRGKACGDSCIARNKTCHRPPGCACNGG